MTMGLRDIEGSWWASQIEVRRRATAAWSGGQGCGYRCGYHLGI